MSPYLRTGLYVFAGLVLGIAGYLFFSTSTSESGADAPTPEPTLLTLGHDDRDATAV